MARRDLHQGAPGADGATGLTGTRGGDRGRSPSTTRRSSSPGSAGRWVSTRRPASRPVARTRSDRDQRLAGLRRARLGGLNELDYYGTATNRPTAGFRRILVTEREHPYVAAWWPPGHLIGYEHAFTHEIVDLIGGIATGSDPDALLPVLLRTLDRGLAGLDVFGASGPRGARPGRVRPPAGGAGGVGGELPRRRPDPVRQRRRDPRQAAGPVPRRPWPTPGWSYRMVTTNLFSHPSSRTGALHRQRPRPYAGSRCQKVLRNIDLAAELGAETFVLWGGREGAESRAARTSARRSTGTARR